MSFAPCRLALAFIASLAASGAALAAPSLCEAGPPTYNGQPSKVWEGDFDADGKPDRLWVLPPGTISTPVADRASDPWSGFRRRFEPGLLTIVIAHGRYCDLIQKPRFFATPLWEEDDKPLKLLLRSDPAIKDWPRISRRWKGDGVLLGTEAGPDVLMYWNGRRWWVAQGTEAP